MTRAIGYGWVISVLALWCVGVLLTYLEGGWSDVGAILSPLNIGGWLITALFLAPGGFLIMWANEKGQ